MLSPADQDRFICIYPAYLNNKTIAEGRQIPISKAVESPTATEIQDVRSAVGLNAFLEKNKMYSREWNRDVQYRGRVRVQLKQEDGSLCLVQFPSRKSVMPTQVFSKERAVRREREEEEVKRCEREAHVLLRRRHLCVCGNSFCVV